MAEVNPEGTISSKMDYAFKEKVEELSKGKIKIDLHFTATLGDEQTIMELLRRKDSTIHLERISAFNMSAYDCNKSSLLASPYTFKNKEHFWKFASSPLAQEVLTESYDNGVGVRGLFFGEEGFRHFFATRPLNSISDFSSLKLRTTSDPIMKDLAHGLGADSVTVAFADLYSALQTGVADAAEQPLANYLANHFNKTAPYMILDGHTLGVTEVIISSAVWDSLSKEQKAVLTEAGKYAGTVCRKISEEAEEKAKDQLLKEGVVFKEIEDLEPWKKACAHTISDITKDDRDFYQKIMSLAD